MLESHVVVEHMDIYRDVLHQNLHATSEENEFYGYTYIPSVVIHKLVCFPQSGLMHLTR